MNRKQFMQWLEGIDPNIVFGDEGLNILFIDPDPYGELLNEDAVVVVDNAETFLFLSLYLENFLCNWQYKGVTLYNSRYGWKADITIKGRTFRNLDLPDFETELDMVKFLILTQDDILPPDPDDSPIQDFTFLNASDEFDAERFGIDDLPKSFATFGKQIVEIAKDGISDESAVEEAFADEEHAILEWFLRQQRLNPFNNAKNLFETNPDAFYDFDPNQHDSLEGWVDAVISSEGDIWGIGADFEASDEDWETAQDEAWDGIYYWFWEWKHKPTQE